MSDTPTLSQIIQESLAVQDPEMDNLEPAQNMVEEVDESEAAVDDILSGLLGEDEDTDDAETDEVEGGGEDEGLNETYRVKVDGEVVDVTLKEALAGYQRQADYTRKAQALAAEREELVAAAQEFSETLQTLSELDAAWDENPVQVLAHFASSTENPTHAVALLIKELASANLLEQEFLDMFGITSDVRKSWAKEGEVETLRRKVSRSESEESERRAAQAYEAEVAKAMAEYERQIDDILVAEGLRNITPAQRANFRTRLASYAHDNELTNLKAAYKALKYEESQKKKQVSEKTRVRAQQKKNASAVGRSGSGSSGSAPVSDSNDLQSIIRAAMSEAQPRS